MDGHEYKTATVKKTVHPIWDQEFAFRGKKEVMLAKPLHVRVYDDDVISGDDKIGECFVDLAPLVEKLQEEEETSVEAAFDTQGVVSLRVKWIWCGADSKHEGTLARMSGAPECSRVPVDLSAPTHPLFACCSQGGARTAEEGAAVH